MKNKQLIYLYDRINRNSRRRAYLQHEGIYKIQDNSELYCPKCQRLVHKDMDVKEFLYWLDKHRPDWNK